MNDGQKTPKYDLILLNIAERLVNILKKEQIFDSIQYEKDTFDSGYYGVTIPVIYKKQKKQIYLILDLGYIGLENHSLGRLYIRFSQLGLYQTFDSRNEIIFPNTLAKGSHFGDVEPSVENISDKVLEYVAKELKKRILNPESVPRIKKFYETDRKKTDGIDLSNWSESVADLYNEYEWLYEDLVPELCNDEYGLTRTDFLYACPFIDVFFYMAHKYTEDYLSRLDTSGRKLELRRAIAEVINIEKIKDKKKKRFDAEIEIKFLEFYSNLKSLISGKGFGALLTKNWWIFKKGTTMSEILQYFTENHSKGLLYLSGILNSIRYGPLNEITTIQKKRKDGSDNDVLECVKNGKFYNLQVFYPMQYNDVRSQMEKKGYSFKILDRLIVFAEDWHQNEPEIMQWHGLFKNLPDQYKNLDQLGQSSYVFVVDYPDNNITAILCLDVFYKDHYINADQFIDAQDVIYIESQEDIDKLN